jgi:pimeloyl-ACP methyl ester carboxylesterase
MNAKFAFMLIPLLAAPAFALAQSVEPDREAPMKSATTKPRIVMEGVFVPAEDPGIQIYVRNKHLAGMNHFAPEKTVLFVHGATYPAETAFDLPLDGLSWMDYIAQRGYDVYLMDVRGYGRSTRPPQMDAPADQNPPFADTATAARDVGAVVDYILARRSLQKLDLLGWSWGTAIMATYTAANAGKVERLVLYAPIWLRETPSLIQVNGPLGAYRTVTRDTAFSRWMTGVPEDKKASLIPAGWFDQWWNATIATDPTGSKQNPPALRAPNGVVQDTQKFWSAGKPTYDPAKITVPVLLIQAEWDQDTPPYMARTLFPLLVNAPEKRYVMIGEGTHSVIMEKNRMQLFREVQVFLDEGATEN